PEENRPSAPPLYLETGSPCDDPTTTRIPLASRWNIRTVPVEHGRKDGRIYIRRIGCISTPVRHPDFGLLAGLPASENPFSVLVWLAAGGDSIILPPRRAACGKGGVPRSTDREEYE
ncbi:hypothetical protein, partial [Streptomyces sp. NPDC002044]|uniref:hypothetical protein n=1 Tax=Streptomyces sp. NPDC002044 TaxID=3154662 RepID=UPI003331B2E2